MKVANVAFAVERRTRRRAAGFIPAVGAAAQNRGDKPDKPRGSHWQHTSAS
jgi:hypothetical protein